MAIFTYELAISSSASRRALDKRQIFPPASLNPLKPGGSPPAPLPVNPPNISPAINPANPINNVPSPSSKPDLPPPAAGSPSPAPAPPVETPASLPTLPSSKPTHSMPSVNPILQSTPTQAGNTLAASTIPPVASFTPPAQTPLVVVPSSVPTRPVTANSSIEGNTATTLLQPTIIAVAVVLGIVGVCVVISVVWCKLKERKRAKKGEFVKPPREFPWAMEQNYSQTELVASPVERA
ncbi:uncharacterized protein SPPG_02355 [Spizellomyces punctatus DAOM BR117]|uniref:Uncharacterized protein n=1 Tax=Spizellomyces punctatus (strain DAOM BR117) TaxID=645134 RepID=A0A0L0HQB4_SPIPD|nr:uncharacterized protein SPPG_02355 [Spizellomyces punctatus DAOM BR117]KND03307.1 hypothetical protein SPPG_02355 [Spizellomyces punctatus DAOM BR117]|eukprot:XP_016611346.1 hypothetical protein SPPG_02355 [Spizellomyces punctatus DAOM BR117]